MAQITATSPISLKVTGVDVPGPCEPRLNSFPLLVDMMLWGTVSSLKKMTASPFLTAIDSAENARPFCVIVGPVAAAAAAHRTAKAPRPRRVVLRITCHPWCGSSGQDRNNGRIDTARQRVEEAHEIGLFLHGEPERLDEIAAARAIDPAPIVVLDHRREGLDRTIVHVRTAVRDLAQAGRLEGMLHLHDICRKLAP